MESIIALIGTATSLIVSVFAVWISLRKMKPEIQQIKTNAEKIEADKEKVKADIVILYSEEIRKIKEDQTFEYEKSRKKFAEFEKRICDLSDELDRTIKERREEQVLYREFIGSLLVGITKLTGQIQLRGETPIWGPPEKTPFDL